MLFKFIVAHFIYWLLVEMSLRRYVPRPKCLYDETTTSKWPRRSG